MRTMRVVVYTRAGSPVVRVSAHFLNNYMHCYGTTVVHRLVEFIFLVTFYMYISERGPYYLTSGPVRPYGKQLEQ